MHEEERSVLSNAGVDFWLINKIFAVLILHVSGS